MPIYEYRCRNCGHKFEEFQSINADPSKTKCPQCGELHSERLFSAFSSGVSSSGGIAAGGGGCGPGTFT